METNKVKLKGAFLQCFVMKAPKTIKMGFSIAAPIYCWGYSNSRATSPLGLCGMSDGVFKPFTLWLFHPGLTNDTMVNYIVLDVLTSLIFRGSQRRQWYQNITSNVDVNCATPKVKQRSITAIICETIKAMVCYNLYFIYFYYVYSTSA